MAQTFSGRVVDEDAEPLQGVSVILLNGKRAVKFSRTDKDGSFHLAAPATAKVDSIRFTQVGRERMAIGVADFANGQIVRLSRKVFELKEVKVKPQKIRQDGDTLNYLVSQFMQKQDRSIADVLAKMPGITVNPSGQIEYNGTPINKFYIEGMDMAGGKYAMLSENLDARKVKKVQVMENHQPIRALRDIKFSEQAAVNIVLRDDVKTTWQGVAHLGAGASLQEPEKMLYDEKLMEMFFARRMQSVSMYKSTNTGKDIEHEISDIGYGKNNERSVSGLVSRLSMNSPNLSDSRYTFNNTHILATNWSFLTPKKNTLRLQATALFDRQKYQQYGQTVYTNVDGDSLVSEERSGRAFRRQYTAELMYQANHDKTFTENTLKGYIDFDSGAGRYLLNGRGISQMVEPRKMYVSDAVKSIVSLSRGRSVTLNGAVAYNYLPGKLLLFNGNRETADLHQMDAEASVAFRHRMAGFYMSYLLGGRMEQQRLSVSNYLTGDSLRKDRYAAYNIFITPNFSYKHAGFSADVALKLDGYYRKDRNNTQWRVSVEPNVSLSYDFNARLQMTARYFYVWAPQDLASTTGLPVFSDYRRFFRGQEGLEATRSHSLMSTLKYRDVVNGWFANASIMYYTTLDTRMMESRLKDGVYYSSFTDWLTHSHLLTVRGEFSKSFDWASSLLSLRASRTQNEYYMLLGSACRPFRTVSSSLLLSLSMRPVSWLSIDTYGRLINSRMESRKGNAPSADPVRFFNERLSLFFFLGDWQLNCVGEFYHGNDKSVSFTHFSDVSVSYRHRAFEFVLSLNNLFGMQEYRRRAIGSTSFSYTETILRPREILAKVIFNM
ncbi:hypothetical protein [Prevotella dentasini]